MGARGPPGTPGDVSKTSAVSRVHGNTAHGHRPAIYEITMMEEIVVILLHCIFYCLFFSSQVANVIPEPGEPVSRLLLLHRPDSVIRFLDVKIYFSDDDSKVHILMNVTKYILSNTALKYNFWVLYLSIFIFRCSMNLLTSY